MKAPLYDDILTICQEISSASTANDDDLRLAGCKKLQVLCATNQNSPKDHPLQWEALADFTEDGDQAMDIYEIALATADKLALPVFTASSYLAMHGNWQPGWESRRNITRAAPLVVRQHPSPRWDRLNSEVDYSCQQ